MDQASQPASDLKHLTLADAAWLLSETPERLAAWAAPRDPAGTFDGQRLVNWYRRHVGYGEPLLFTDAEHQAVVQAGLSSIPEGKWQELHQALDAIKQHHGDAGLLAYGRLLYWLSGPDAAWTHRSETSGPSVADVQQWAESEVRTIKYIVMKSYAAAPDMLAPLMAGKNETEAHAIISKWASGVCSLLNHLDDDQTASEAGVTPGQP